MYDLVYFDCYLDLVLFFLGLFLLFFHVRSFFYFLSSQYFYVRSFFFIFANCACLGPFFF